MIWDQSALESSTWQQGSGRRGLADQRPPTPDSKGLISVPGTKGTAWGTELMVSHRCCLVTDSNYACGEHGITVVVESLGLYTWNGGNIACQLHSDQTTAKNPKNLISLSLSPVVFSSKGTTIRKKYLGKQKSIYQATSFGSGQVTTSRVSPLDQPTAGCGCAYRMEMDASATRHVLHRPAQRIHTLLWEACLFLHSFNRWKTKAQKVKDRPKKWLDWVLNSGSALSKFMLLATKPYCLFKLRKWLKHTHTHTHRWQYQPNPTGA